MREESKQKRDRDGCPSGVTSGVPLTPPLRPLPPTSAPRPPRAQASAVASLAHFKERVESVRKGSECGIALEGVTAGYEVGDRILAVKVTREKQKLEVRYDYAAAAAGGDAPKAARGGGQKGGAGHAAKGDAGDPKYKARSGDSSSEAAPPPPPRHSNQRPQQRSSGGGRK